MSETRLETTAKFPSTAELGRLLIDYLSSSLPTQWSFRVITYFILDSGKMKRGMYWFFMKCVIIVYI